MYRAIALLAILLPMPWAAHAACSIATTGVAFGNYRMTDPGPNDSSGGITVTCPGLLGLLVTVTTDLSTGISNSYFPRQMGSGSNRLSYNLYLNPGRTSVWGNGGGGTGRQTFSALVTLLTLVLSYDVYGRIPAGQAAAAGDYSDTVVITVTY